VKEQVKSAIIRHTLENTKRIHGGKMIEAIRATYGSIRKYSRRWLQNKNHVLMRQEPFKPVIDPPADFKCYSRVEDVPDIVWEATLQNRGKGSSAVENDRIELQQNALMWVAFISGETAGIVFTRQGRYFKRWFVELEADAIVVFRGWTWPKFRRRGIATALGRHAVNSLYREGCKIYADCQVFNLASKLGLQKEGFKLIATKKPISRKEATGDLFE
jgi:GNAT superfamily N-acetyltransferase